MIQQKTRTLQLEFVTRPKELPDKNCAKQWKYLTSYNPFYQLHNRLKNSTSPLKDPVHKQPTYREYYKNCPLFQPLLVDLYRAFGNLPTLSTKLQPLDFINNRFPRAL
ncbi:hypothetical protein BDC45DRAFT_532012 [Circinella umbellata]|nr:hypothetical protein BDC45DRAFT_532012 [Circinella umbellata]